MIRVMYTFAPSVMAGDKNNWFKDWFDSKHYHMLYQHRDFDEARAFIKRLFEHLALEKADTKVLDLACGKGRHALQVHQLGYNVLGVDLSTESIKHAKQYEEFGLSFEVADMRSLGLDSEIDLLLNLFTSFGYFKSEEENLSAIISMAKALKAEGRIVLDYLNVDYVIHDLPQKHVIQRETVDFNISKSVEDGFIVKDIRFSDGDERHHYQEFVKVLRKVDFEYLFNQAGLRITETFGNYHLEPFDVESSDRLIMIVERC